MRKQSVKQRMSIIAAITNARVDAKLSKRELSEKLGGHTTVIQKIESGDRNVTVEKFIRIAQAMNVDPVELFRRALR